MKGVHQTIDYAELVPRRVHVEGAAWPQCSNSTCESLPRHCPEVPPVDPDLSGTVSNSFSQSYHKRKRYTIWSHPVELSAGRVSTQSHGDTHTRVGLNEWALP